MGSNPTFSRTATKMVLKKFPSEKTQQSKHGKICFLYCRFSKQNSIFTLTTLENNVLLTISNGMCGFKNSTSKTKFATNFTALRLSKEARGLNFKRAIVIFKGQNKGRRKCVKFLRKHNLKIIKVIDQTSMAHNGCRPSKKPRL